MLVLVTVSLATSLGGCVADRLCRMRYLNDRGIGIVPLDREQFAGYQRANTRFVSMLQNMLRPGDTVCATATVTAIDPERRRVTLSTTCHVGDTTVIDGEALVWVPAPN